MKSILVVDDEPHATRILQHRLEGAGHSVDVAANGEEALARLEAHAYDIVVTDLCMPRMDGRELCQAIQAQSAHRGVHIILVTSRPEDEIRRFAREIPQLEFMEKPVNLRELLERVEAK